jgi:hypothetical protein
MRIRARINRPARSSDRLYEHLEPALETARDRDALPAGLRAHGYRLRSHPGVSGDERRDLVPHGDVGKAIRSGARRATRPDCAAAIPRGAATHPTSTGTASTHLLGEICVVVAIRR